MPSNLFFYFETKVFRANCYVYFMNDVPPVNVRVLSTELRKSIKDADNKPLEMSFVIDERASRWLLYLSGGI